ncbi:hypothetical protein QL285_035993 [Trifolium repens]|nr:hypothetical protein QL285_035993 [Trifolium repens]
MFSFKTDSRGEELMLTCLVARKIDLDSKVDSSLKLEIRAFDSKIDFTFNSLLARINFPESTNSKSIFVAEPNTHTSSIVNIYK